MKELITVLFAKNNTDLSFDNGNKTVTYGCSFLALVSAILTALNLVMGYYLMAESTLALLVGFLLAAFLSIRGKVLPSRIVAAILCAFIFTYYAISGQNDGFAILWIIFIPVIGYFLLGLRVGFFLCLYFQIFLIVLFYSPLNAVVSSLYSQTFQMRFPLLYFASFGAITLLFCQMQVMHNRVHRQAFYDDMTGLLNRRRYNQTHNKLSRTKDLGNLAVVTFDLNRLKYVNDHMGHDAGDALITQAASYIAQAFEGDDCYRTGGDEFVAISKRGKDAVEQSMATLRRTLADQDTSKENAVSISFGAAFAEDIPSPTFSSLSLASEQGMYADKTAFYQQSGYDRRQ